MKPALRKLTVTAHVTFSIGWLGAVAAFLVLSIAGLTSRDPDVVRSAYLSMDLISRFAIIPMCFVALATGLIEALGTPWGLFRHYWVAIKFALTCVATLLLLMHQHDAIARAAKWVSGTSATQLFTADFVPLQTELAKKSALAIALLIGITALGIYKPWGLTAYGRRKLSGPLALSERAAPATPWGVKILYAAAGLLLVTILLLLSGHGLGRHHH